MSENSSANASIKINEARKKELESAPIPLAVTGAADDKIRVGNNQGTYVQDKESLASELLNYTGGGPSGGLGSFLGWIETPPVTAGTNIGDFYYKGVEPNAEGYYRWDGSIWVAVAYGTPVDLNGHVLNDGSVPFIAPQVGVFAEQGNHLVTLGQVDAYVNNLYNITTEQGFKIDNHEDRITTLESDPTAGLPEYLKGVPANFNYGAATNFPFTELDGQEIKVKPEDMDRKFTQCTSNIAGTITGQYMFIIDVAGSTLADNTDVYLDFEWWFDYDSITTSSEVQIWLGGQRLDMTQTNTGNTAIGGSLKGWYKIKKSLNKAMALR